MVELVVVVILLAIISLYAASKFIGVKNFSGYAAQDQSMTVIRRVQLGRMQSNVTDSDCEVCDHYKLQITPTCLGSVASCNSATDEFSDHVILEGTNLSFSPTSQIHFDLRGNPSRCDSDGNNCAPIVSPMVITIQDQGGDSFELCINREGYIGDANDC